MERGPTRASACSRRSRARSTTAARTAVGTISWADSAFGDGIVPDSRTPKSFQNPSHSSLLPETSPGDAYSARQMSALATATTQATTITRSAPPRAVQAATISTITGAAMLLYQPPAARQANSSGKRANVLASPNAVPISRASPSQTARTGRQRKRSRAMRTRTPAASGSRISSRAERVRATESGSKATDVATKMTSPDNGATRARAPAAMTQIA